ncbi:MAG: hypothetical protein GQ542_06720 [Desulforhopalus sp.]|nr:hypothetical protein [Desulforhopalus sp.]
MLRKRRTSPKTRKNGKVTKRIFFVMVIHYPLSEIVAFMICLLTISRY